MKTGISLILCVFMAACGGGESGYTGSMEYDYITQSGVRVRVDPGSDLLYPPTPDHVEAAYQYTMACVGLVYDGPLVVVRASEYVPPPPRKGVAWFGIGVIELSHTRFNAVDMPPEYTLFTLRHEMVHYLLDRAGFPESRNSSHDSPLFEQCASYPDA